MKIQKILFFTVIGLLAAPIIALVLFFAGAMTYSYFTYTPVHENDIASLNLYFRTVRRDSTTKIFFGGKDKLDDFIEVYPSADVGGVSIYFVIDNTTDSPKVEQVIFEDGRYFDFHVRNYDYSVNLYKFPHNPKDPTEMYAILRELPDITDNSHLPHNRIIVHAWLAPYNKGMDFSVYDLSDEHYAQLLDEMVSNKDYVMFPQLLENGVDLSVKAMKSAHGNPFDCRKFNLTKDNKRDFFSLGWLFVDTLNVDKQGFPIEQLTWDTDKGETTIIYKIVNDSTYIPINGAYLPRFYIVERDSTIIPLNGAYSRDSESGDRLILK